jgi:hypothetical protein
MEDFKARFLYLGKEWRENKESAVHRYAEVSEDNKIISTNYVYDKKLFKKGSVGALYDVTLKNKKETVSYSKNETATYMVKVGDGNFKHTGIYFKDVLDACEIKDRLAGVQEQIRKKPPIKDPYKVEHLRQLYKEATASQKPFFIAEIIRQITK